jgi:uncharacterized membrane protein (DUF485 family)
MYQARKVSVPGKKSECINPGKRFLAWNIHFSVLVRSLSWLGTLTFLAWYIHFPGLVHSLFWLGTFTFLAWYIHFFGLIHSLSWLTVFRLLTDFVCLYNYEFYKKMNVPSQKSECTKPEK